jgi:NADPH2:quinone reductase
VHCGKGSDPAQDLFRRAYFDIRPEEERLKAILVNEAGNAGKLVVSEVPLSEPRANEVQVKISYAGVNFMDIGTRLGQFSHYVPMPLIPGVEGAGVVVHVGADVKDFEVGDRVAWVLALGSYAEFINIPEGSLVRIPDDIDDQTAASIMMNGITAYHFAVDFYETKAGDVALVHAASGGVGLLLTQIIKNRQGRVIGRVSSEQKVRTAKDAGADDVIVATDHFAQAVLDLTGGRGVDVVFDGSGPSTFVDSTRSLKRYGTFCWFGPILGNKGTVDLVSLPNGIKIGYTTYALSVSTPQALRQVSNQLFDWVREEKLTIKIHKVYPLAETKQAHLDMEARITGGKLLIQP